MNGLELARYYYETAGKQALERQVPDLVPRLAIGLAGEGSECFGLDDELSRDHDLAYRYRRCIAVCRMPLPDFPCERAAS